MVFTWTFPIKTIKEKKMKEVRLIPVGGIPLVNVGDDIAQLIYKACQENSIVIEEGDIIVIAQKIVSKAENSVVNLSTVKPTKRAVKIAEKTGRDPRLVQVYLNEASKVLFIKGRMVITKHKLGFKMSSSGVDKSNVAPLSDEVVVLLPRDPDGSARKIRESMKIITGENIAVIINDSCGRDDRDGSVGMAIGIAGISHLEFRSQKDLFGNESSSRIALIDELAAAASILMGQADEKIPVVIIRGVRYTVDEKASIKNILG